MEIQKWMKKKEKARVDGNLDQLFYSCKELAEIYFREEKYDEALIEYKEMERLSEANSQILDVARANRMIGEVYCEKGEFSKAIKHQMKHLVISREENDKVEEQRALATLGRTHFLLAESVVDSASSQRSEALREAKKFYMQSLSISQKLNDEEVGNKQRMEMIARLFLNIGLVLDCENQYESAIDHMLKAVTICKKLDLWEDLYRTYSALGASYQKHKNTNQALKMYDMALDIAERLSNKTELFCEILPLKAEVLLDLPDFRGARQALLKAYRLHAPSVSVRREIEKKLRIVAVMYDCEEKLTQSSPDEEFQEKKKLYEEMGDAAAEINHFGLAITYYNRMLECVEKCGGVRKALIDCYVSLAQTYKDDHQYSKALEYFEKELLLEEDVSSEACRTHTNIADIHQILGNTDGMIKSYEKAKICALQVNDHKLLRTVLRSMETALIECNKVTLAEEVKNEMNSMALDFADELSDEDDAEEEFPRQFGSQICLEDLTDEEGGSADKQERGKSSRTRTKPKTNLQKRNEKGETPLHVAAIQGNVNLATKLIEQGHSVDVRDYSGWTPLHEACNHGHVGVVRALLKAGAPVNDRGGPHCDGVTPLLDAAANGSLDVVEILLEHGASPLARTNRGESVLDSLSGWKDRRFSELGVDLDDITNAHYWSIYNHLKQTLEKAGQTVSSKNKSPKKDVAKFPNSRSRRCSDISPSHSRAPGNHPRRTSADNFKTLKQESSEGAASEYETTIKALRFRNKKDTAPPLSTSKLAMPALLMNDQTVGDDWLEDDLDSRPNKKRKTGEFVGEPLRRRKSAGDPVSPDTVPSPPHAQPSWEDPYNECLQSESQQHEDSENSNESYQNLVDAPSSCESFKRRLKENKASKRRQLSLTSAGVSVERIAPPSCRTQTNISSSNFSSASFSCVKVRVEDKLLMVPLPQDREMLTVNWLAEEAANRYRSLEGVEPVLRLQMEDGALLLGTDPVAILLGQGEVKAQVQSWKTTSLLQLYEEACRHLNSECVEEVCLALERCQATGVMTLEDMYLRTSRLGPLLRALSHHTPLHTLSLPGNNISDTGIRDVAECVCKLSQLKCLDLSNINISSDGLQILSDVLVSNRAIQRLEKLKLGYNPLEECLRPLAELINALPALRRLSIPSIGLTHHAFRSFPHFMLDSVEYLDLNYNEPGAEGLIDLLGRLEARRVVELRLAGTGPRTIREMGLWLEEKAPPCLRALDLSYCPATHLDLDQLIRGARQCVQLERLWLDGVSCSAALDLSGLRLAELSLCGVQMENLPPCELARLTLATNSCLPQQLMASSRRGPWALIQTTSI